VIVVDDEDRENEGDFTIAAEKISPDAINFMAKHGRGLICLALTGERLDELELPLMVDDNQSKYGTAFTVSIESRKGVTTGISAADRATTVLTAVNPSTRPKDLVRPGHIFPLRARSGGVLERAGQTEAAVDLSRLAGLYPAGVICEIMKDDGTMARVPELTEVANAHDLKMVTVADIIAFRLKTETFVNKVCESELPTEFGEFRAIVFENTIDGENHIALVKGEIDPDVPTLVRVQSQATMGDVFHSLRSDSGEQLRGALKIINEAGSGILVYLRQDRKGLGLVNEIRAYAMEESAEQTGENTASHPLKPNLRIYGVGAQILRQLGARNIRLLTNHPRKIIGLQGFGITVVERVPLEIAPNKHSEEYLRLKKNMLGHLLESV
jgi:3,4-dihydroxy 2-butanone 4-phosphate synthase/GTP cyclohydrolase II